MKITILHEKFNALNLGKNRYLDKVLKGVSYRDVLLSQENTEKEKHAFP